MTAWRRYADRATSHRHNPVCITMFVDEILQDFNKRLGSAWSKNALATSNISSVRCSSLTSHYSSLTLWASLVVTPSSTLASTLVHLTHSFQVCGTQPIMGAMDSMAAHRDRYSPRYSCTMHTAHSRTSGEAYLTSSWLNLLKVLSPLKTEVIAIATLSALACIAGLSFDGQMGVVGKTISELADWLLRNQTHPLSWLC